MRLRRAVVAEIGDAVRVFRRSAPASSDIQFLNFRDVLGIEPVDIIYANAALHYADSLDDFWATVQSLCPRSILLDGFLGTVTSTFYLTQHVHGTAVPICIRNLSDLLNRLEQQGYTTVHCAPMLGPVQGNMTYGLPLAHLGLAAAQTKRYTILARRQD